MPQPPLVMPEGQLSHIVLPKPSGSNSLSFKKSCKVMPVIFVTMALNM